VIEPTPAMVQRRMERIRRLRDVATSDGCALAAVPTNA